MEALLRLHRLDCCRAGHCLPLLRGDQVRAQQPIYLHVFQTNIDFRGPTLEEIARIFDGDNAEVGAVHVKDAPGLANDHYDMHEKTYAEKQEVMTTAIEKS